MIRIGLIGAPGAGKDAVADFLVDKKKFKKLAFADQIKREYYAISCHTEEQFKASRGTLMESEIRNSLWCYSDDAKEKYGKYHFIQPVIDRISQSTDNIVVSDVRTDLEMYKMKEIGAQLIVVSRDYNKDFNGEKIPGTKLKVESIHSLRVFINNFETLEELHTELEKFYKEI